LGAFDLMLDPTSDTFDDWKKIAQFPGSNPQRVQARRMVDALWEY
jgi:hypothetical protein